MIVFERQSDLLALQPSENIEPTVRRYLACVVTRLLYCSMEWLYAWHREAVDEALYQRAAARLIETGFAADFAGTACTGAESHPPDGLATLTASSG
jgi:hypothetical protein